MQIGDHVFASKPVFGQHGRFYTHHGIYIGRQQVIPQGTQRLASGPFALAGAAVAGIGYGLYRL